MARVSIRNAVKAYGTAQVLHGVSVDAADGEFVVLVGPSGCGKSTLLRMIAGLETITDGEIAIGDRVVNDLEPKERDIAMVFQSYALYPHMSVRDNMAFSLKLARRSKEEIRHEVDRAAEILHLQPLLDRYPRQLSGGQRQRVAMGRAIVRNPAVFLFDEPLSNLDAKLRVQMRAEIKALHQRLGTTMIYVTHDQMEAMTMADRIVVMRSGVIEQVGAPLDLYDNPDTVFVAGFIGSPAMNFITGVVQSGTKPSLKTDDGFVWPLPSEAASLKGQRVIIGLRPEDIAVADGPVTGTLQNVEPTGAENLITAQIGSQSVTVSSRERLSPPIGSSIPLRPDLRKMKLFDAASEKRIDLRRHA